MAARKKNKPIPLSKWAKNALKEINKEFPPNTKIGRHPFVVITRLLVLAKDAGVNPWARSVRKEDRRTQSEIKARGMGEMLAERRPNGADQRQSLPGEARRSKRTKARHGRPGGRRSTLFSVARRGSPW